MDHTPRNVTTSPRHRYGLLAVLFAISVVTYVDRVNISIAARQMMPAFGLTDIQMGHVFSAFVVGYALFQIPGGWCGDRWGARHVLTGAVLWWSVFTALTALAGTSPLVGVIGILGSLFVIRFFLGVGEALAFPNFNRVVADWMPASQRGLGIGFAISGIGAGAALTPPLAAWVMVNWGWQTVFYLSAIVGLAVAGAWHWHSGRALYRDQPAGHMTSSSHAGGESEGIRVSVPWARFLRTPTVWWLVASYTCLGYVAYVYMAWFYLYLVNVRGFDTLRGGWFAAAPFMAILVFCPLGGWVTDTLVPRFGTTKARVLTGASGMGLAAASIAIGSLAPSPWLAVGCLSLGAGWLYFTVGAYWASAADLSPRHAGTLSGVMNTGANIGGSLSPTLTPWIAEQWGWAVSLLVAAGIALLGGTLWLFTNPGNGLTGERNKSA